MQQQDEGPRIHRKHVLAPRTALRMQESESTSCTGSTDDSGYIDASMERSDDNAGDSTSL